MSLVIKKLNDSPTRKMAFKWFLFHFFSLKIRIGNSNLELKDDGQNIIVLDIVKAFVHPKFNKPAAYFDIAVLVTRPIKFSRTITPVCLPDTSNDSIDTYKNYHVELTGWGQDNLHSALSKRLKRVSLLINPQRYDFFFKTWGCFSFSHFVVTWQ